MSGAGFRGRGPVPRGRNLRGMGLEGVSGIRNPQPNFNQPRREGHPPPQDFWLEHPGPAPWQQNEFHHPHSQYAFDYRFLRGRPQYCSSIAARGRSKRGVRGDGRPPRGIYQPGGYQMPMARPPQPETVKFAPLGSEEERQQKIAETADKLKQKLSSLTVEKPVNFWDENPADVAFASDDQEQHLISNRGIPELRHDPPELNLTVGDFKDIGRVDPEGFGNSTEPQDATIAEKQSEEREEAGSIDSEIYLIDNDEAPGNGTEITGRTKETEKKKIPASEPLEAAENESSRPEDKETTVNHNPELSESLEKLRKVIKNDRELEKKGRAAALLSDNRPVFKPSLDFRPEINHPYARFQESGESREPRREQFREQSRFREQFWPDYQRDAQGNFGPDFNRYDQGNQRNFRPQGPLMNHSEFDGPPRMNRQPMMDRCNMGYENRPPQRFNFRQDQPRNNSWYNHEDAVLQPPPAFDPRGPPPPRFISQEPEPIYAPVLPMSYGQQMPHMHIAPGPFVPMVNGNFNHIMQPPNTAPCIIPEFLPRIAKNIDSQTALQPPPPPPPVVPLEEIGLPVVGETEKPVPTPNMNEELEDMQEALEFAKKLMNMTDEEAELVQSLNMPTFPDLPPIPSTEPSHLVEEEQVDEAKEKEPESQILEDQTRTKVVFNVNSTSKMPSQSKQSEETAARLKKIREKLANPTLPQLKVPKPAVDGERKERKKKPEESAPQEITAPEIPATSSKAGKSLLVSTVDANWKDKVINQFLKMSKNDICNMVNSSGLRKFDIAMKHLVKERKNALSQERRTSADDAVKGNCDMSREEFMNQLSAMLDPSATVDVKNLPAKFIQHLSEVLKLDVESHLNEAENATQFDNGGHEFAPQQDFAQFIPAEEVLDTEDQTMTPNIYGNVFATQEIVDEPVPDMEVLDDIFSAGIARAKLGLVPRFPETSSPPVVDPEPVQQPYIRARCTKTLMSSQPEESRNSDAWNRKKRQDPDLFRNLTKEEWEARGGNSAQSRTPSSRETSLGARSKSPKQQETKSHRPRNRSPPTPKNSVEQTRNDSCSDFGSSLSSDGEASSQPRVNKLLKVIKDREKVAKNMTLGESMRDEVNAEMERERETEAERKLRKREKCLRRRERKERLEKESREEETRVEIKMEDPVSIKQEELVIEADHPTVLDTAQKSLVDKNGETSLSAILFQENNDYGNLKSREMLVAREYAGRQEAVNHSSKPPVSVGAKKIATKTEIAVQRPKEAKIVLEKLTNRPAIGAKIPEKTKEAKVVLEKITNRSAARKIAAQEIRENSTTEKTRTESPIQKPKETPTQKITSRAATAKKIIGGSATPEKIGTESPVEKHKETKITTKLKDNLVSEKAENDLEARVSGAEAAASTSGTKKIDITVYKARKLQRNFGQREKRSEGVNTRTETERPKAVDEPTPPKRKEDLGSATKKSEAPKVSKPENKEEDKKAKTEDRRKQRESEGSREKNKRISQEAPSHGVKRQDKSDAKDARPHQNNNVLETKERKATKCDKDVEEKIERRQTRDAKKKSEDKVKDKETRGDSPANRSDKDKRENGSEKKKDGKSRDEVQKEKECEKSREALKQKGSEKEEIESEKTREAPKQKKSEKTDEIEQQKESNSVDEVQKLKKAGEAEEIVKQKDAEKAEEVLKEKEEEKAEEVLKQKEEEKTVKVLKQKEEEKTVKVLKQKEEEKTEEVLKQKEEEKAEEVLKQKEEEKTEEVLKQKEEEKAEELLKQKEEEKTEEVLKQKEEEKAEELLKQKEEEKAEEIVKQKEAEEAEEIVKQKEAEKTEDIVKHREFKNVEEVSEEKEIEKTAEEEESKIPVKVPELEEAKLTEEKEVEEIAEEKETEEMEGLQRQEEATETGESNPKDTKTDETVEVSVSQSIEDAKSEEAFNSQEENATESMNPEAESDLENDAIDKEDDKSEINEEKNVEDSVSAVFECSNNEVKILLNDLIEKAISQLGLLNASKNHSDGETEAAKHIEECGKAPVLDPEELDRIEGGIDPSILRDFGVEADGSSPRTPGSPLIGFSEDTINSSILGKRKLAQSVLEITEDFARNKRAKNLDDMMLDIQISGQRDAEEEEKVDIDHGPGGLTPSGDTLSLGSSIDFDQGEFIVLSEISSDENFSQDGSLKPVPVVEDKEEEKADKTERVDVANSEVELNVCIEEKQPEDETDALAEPVVEMPPLPDEKVEAKTPKPEPAKKESAKAVSPSSERSNSRSLHRVKHRHKTKHKKDKNRKMSEKKVKEVAKDEDIVTLTKKQQTREVVMNRMIEIDIEINKLMSEKMKLYHMLESGELPTEQNPTIAAKQKSPTSSKTGGSEGRKDIAEKDSAAKKNKKPQRHSEPRKTASDGKKKHTEEKSKHRTSPSHGARKSGGVKEAAFLEDVDLLEASLRGKKGEPKKKDSVRKIAKDKKDEAEDPPENANNVLQAQQIYSDESSQLSASSLQESTKAGNKKGLKGLALLEESYKREKAISKKRRSNLSRASKKEEAKPPVKGAILSSEEDMPLELLYVKKFRKKSAKSGAEVKRTKSTEVLDHVLEAINAVAENKVEEYQRAGKERKPNPKSKSEPEETQGETAENLNCEVEAQDPEATKNPIEEEARNEEAEPLAQINYEDIPDIDEAFVKIEIEKPQELPQPVVEIHNCETGAVHVPSTSGLKRGKRKRRVSWDGGRASKRASGAKSELKSCSVRLIDCKYTLLRSFKEVISPPPLLGGDMQALSKAGFFDSEPEHRNSEEYDENDLEIMRIHAMSLPPEDDEVVQDFCSLEPESLRTLDETEVDQELMDVALDSGGRDACAEIATGVIPVFGEPEETEEPVSEIIELELSADTGEGELLMADEGELLMAEDDVLVVGKDPSDEEADEVQEVELPKVQYSVHKGPILDVKVFGDSILAASEDGVIYRYSQTCNGILNTYEGHRSAVTCIYVLPSVLTSGTTRDLLFSGSLDGSLRCYDITTSVQVRGAADVGSPIQCMDQSWGMIYLGTKSGYVFRFHIKSHTFKGDEIKFSEESVLALKATTEGPRRVLIVASRSQPITIRDAKDGLFLRTLSGQKTHTVYSLMMDSNLVYCGTSSTAIPVFDFINGSQTRMYNAGPGVVCMKMYKWLLFAGCYDGNIYVFDTKEQRLVCSIPGPGNMLLSMDIVKNKIVAGSKDRRLHMWRMPDQVLSLLSKRNSVT